MVKSRRLPPLNALRAFETAGRLESLTDAAAELNVTPSVVGHQVKGLVRQAKLGASCRVEVPVGQGFSHPLVSSAAFVAEYRHRITRSSQGC
jgi:hypothetical protein